MFQRNNGRTNERTKLLNENPRHRNLFHEFFSNGYQCTCLVYVWTKRWSKLIETRILTKQTSTNKETLYHVTAYLYTRVHILKLILFVLRVRYLSCVRCVYTNEGREIPRYIVKYLSKVPKTLYKRQFFLNFIVRLLYNLCYTTCSNVARRMRERIYIM